MDMIILIVEVWIAAIFGILITLFILKMRNAGKSTVVKLRANHTYTTEQIKTKGDELLFSKHLRVKFSPLDLFIEDKPAFKFWRLPKQILFYLDGTLNALSWKEKDGKLESESLLNKWSWSLDEATDFNKKMVKKAMVEARPISQTMFYILVALGVLNLLFLFMMLQRLGGF